MAGEWQRHDVIRLINAGTLVIGDGYRAKNEELGTSGLPFARAGNINDGFRFKDADHFPEDGLPRIGNKVSEPGDVVFTSKGTVGRFAFVRTDTPRFVYSPQLCFWRSRDPNVLDSRFLFYWMFGREFFVQFKGVAGQTDMADYVSLTDQRRMHITLPPLPEQRAIAHILGTLDDKIELNRRMSGTLEAIARALFESWFIRFDPVRWNMARKGHGQPSPPTPLPLGEGRRGEGAKHEGEGRKPNYRGGYDFAGLVETARALRKKQTSAEAMFWEMVRDRRLLGLKFRRQHQLGDYVADFYCHEHRLVIEFDGGIHSAKQRKDHQRDAWMAAQGFKVLRFKNEQLLNDPESVLSAIAQVVESCASPLPLGEGRGEGSVEELDRLFPARLVDSELGEIPEGWEVAPIGDLAEIVGGSTPKTERAEYWEGGTHHWVTPKDLSGLSMPVLLDTERKITDAGLGQISSGLLPKGTVLLSSRAPIGYLAIAEIPVAVNQGFIAMKPRPGVSNLFLLRWARAAHDEIVSHANGSTFLEISKASFRPIRTVRPDARVMDAFDRMSRPMYLKVVEHERESRTLAALRDALLSKLISGEIRVKDAKTFLDGVSV